MSRKILASRNLMDCGNYKGFSEENGGALYLAKNSREGYFVSCIYDSGENAMEWNRLLLNIDMDLVILAHVWLFDRREEGELPDEHKLNEHEPDRQLLVSKLYEHVKKSAQYHSDYRDILLYGKERGCGRFARFAVAVFSQDGGTDMKFQGYVLSFPKESFTRYLPGIYRENLGLERFLAVQQSLYLNLEWAIDSLAEAMDHANCSKTQAVRLAKWVGWGDFASQVDDATLQALLDTGISLISRKGTCGYYRELVKILTGKSAIIVEEPEKCAATVLISEKPEGDWQKKLKWLRQNVPIGMDIRFLVLEKTDRLNEMFFLDKTAMVSKYESELTADGVDMANIRLL